MKKFLKFVKKSLKMYINSMVLMNSWIYYSNSMYANNSIEGVQKVSK
jgi:hypothetical protein